MSMYEQPKLIIRDGVKEDILKCVGLDSTYQTEHVWQMTVREEIDETHITLRKQRLPRSLDASHPSDAKRLTTTIQQKYCFIILVESTSDTLMGYISLRVDPIYHVAYLQDIVIDKLYRRQNLGSRLLNVAQSWANENKLKQLIFEIPTTNHPCIEFAKSHGFSYCGFNDQFLPNQEIVMFFSLSL
jgi:ribosomal protein S18 acetylase RimI-like enzyme